MIVNIRSLLVVLSTLFCGSYRDCAANTASERTVPVHYVEISRRAVNLGDHKMTFVRVRTPVLPVRLPTPPIRKLTSLELSASELKMEKAYRILNVTATVYLDGNRALTEIRWRNLDSGNLEYRAWSNADFRYLTQVNHLESETTIYSWFPFVSVYNLSRLPSEERPQLPADLALSNTEAEYYVDKCAKEAPDQEETLAGLDYLHAYYQLHHAELKIHYDQLMAANAAREKELRENPPVKPDITVRVWSIRSDVNTRSTR